jgi:hypothetical protein
VKAAISELQQHVLASSHTIEKGVQQASAAIESSKQASSTSLLNVKDCLASGNATLVDINASTYRQANIVNQSLSSVKKSLASGRRERGVLLRHQKASSSKVMNRLNDVCSTLTQQIATIHITESADNEMVFEGENLGAITLPLMLMQTDLNKAVPTLVAEGAIKVSRAEARWIQDEFAKLLACGHEAAALAARIRCWKIGKGPAQDIRCAHSAQIPSPRMSSRSNGRCHSEDHALVSKLKTAHWFQQRRRFHTAAGILIMESNTHHEGAHIFDQSSSSPLAFRISFLPKINLSSVSVTASFSKQFGADMSRRSLGLCRLTT